MDSNTPPEPFGQAVHVTPAGAGVTTVLVCEHAVNRVPAFLDGLGLAPEDLESHIAWDPGALGVAQALARALQGLLVHGGVSRLVYDCNRPPDAPSAIPEQSETYTIPGNTGLSETDIAARVNNVYKPFSQTLSTQIAANRATLDLMVTVHSFTPVFHGHTREVEIGILHGKDSRFAKAMMTTAAQLQSPFTIRLNEPYAASDGVAHTLDAHGTANGLMNVMIEIRSDLIATPEQQTAMANHLVPWIGRTQAHLSAEAPL